MRICKVILLTLLLLPGIVRAETATETVAPVPLSPQTVRIGYTTYRPPAEDLAGTTSLKQVTQYLETTNKLSRQKPGFGQPFNFDIYLGNYYQMVSWLESKDLAAAIVSPFQAALLEEKNIAVPLAEFAFSTEHPDGHWVILSATGHGVDRVNPVWDYQMYLKELLQEAVEHPGECRGDAPWRRHYRLNAVAHLSTTGFIAPVLHASDWLEAQAQATSTVRDRFWDCFFDNIRFTLVHSKEPPAPSQLIEIKFSYRKGLPDTLHRSDTLGFHAAGAAPPIPNDVLMVRKDILLADKSDELKKTFLAAAEHSGMIPVNEESYVSVRPYDRRHYEAFKARIFGLLHSPALKYRFTRWYDQGYYDFSIKNITTFFRQDKEISDQGHLSLVLPGGGVKSAYQAEMLDHLYREGDLTNSPQATGSEQGPLLVKDVVGTSGGAMVGLFTAQKRAGQDDASLHGLWAPGPEVFPLVDLMRWVSLYAVMLFFFFLFYAARILGWIDIGGAQDRAGRHRTPYWLSLLLLGILFGGPLLVLLIRGEADQTEMPWGEGLIYLLTVVTVYFAMACCVEELDGDPPATAPARKSLRWPGFSALLLAAACLAAAFGKGWPLAASAGLFILTAALVLLARERRLGLCLQGLRECARALSVLSLVLAVAYLFFYLLSLAGKATSIELTEEFWICLLMSTGAVSLTCFFFAKRGRGLRHDVYEGIRYLGSTHRLGRIHAEHAQAMTLLFGIGLLWWSLVAAPAIYSGGKAYAAFYKNVKNSSLDREHVHLQTNLIVTATALEDVQNGIVVGDERLPLEAGDIYFCFAGEHGGCPQKPSERWFEIGDRKLKKVAHPVFASGSPFPVFPPHRVRLPVAGLKETEMPPLALLVDGGYAHLVPLQAAALAGARQVLIVRSEPFRMPQPYRRRWFPSQLARYSELLLPFMFDQAQEIDRSVARGMFVASLSPYALPDRKVPLLTDFDAATVHGMLKNADEDFRLDRRIGFVESWGLPVLFRQIRDGSDAQDMFERKAVPREQTAPVLMAKAAPAAVR